MKGGVLAAAFFTIVVLSVTVDAWTDKSYQILAQRLCDRFNCPCRDEVEKSVLKPHKTIKDEPSHHCFNTSIPLDVVGYWSQPVQDDCPALRKMQIWIDDAEKNTGCVRWDSISKGFHYFLDAREFWSQVVKPDRKCVFDYDEQVEVYLTYTSGDWTACSCQTCITGSEIDGLLEEYAERIKHFINARHNEEPTIVILANEADWEENQQLKLYLEEAQVRVLRTNAVSFKNQLNNEYIVVMGGTRAGQGVGEIVGRMLTQEEENRGLASKTIGVSYVKKNVYVSGQELDVVAGYTKKETAEKAWEMRDEMISKALTFASRDVEGPECMRAEDCGTGYQGPMICENRYSKPYQITYKPHCRRQRCVYAQSAKKQYTCDPDEICLTGKGCVRNDTVVEEESYRIPPISGKLLRGSRITVFKDREVTNDVYLYNKYNTSLSCHYFGGEGWTSKGSIGLNDSLSWSVAEEAPNEAGLVEYVYRVRCGNGTTTDFSSLFEENYTFRVQYIDYPLVFGFHIEPDEIDLLACNGARYVDYRVVNHGVKNLSCTLTPQLLEPFNISVRNETVFEDAGGEFLHNVYNVTNQTYEVTWLQENLTVENVSFFGAVYTVGYNISKPNWAEGQLLIHTNNCSHDTYTVSARCTDTEEMTSTKTETIKINYVDPGYAQ